MRSGNEAGLGVEAGLDWPEIREGVRAVCRAFPGSYWRGLEDTGQYATDFVAALTQAGYLAALIPEEHGGLGLPLRAGGVILEEIHAAGCEGETCHAQMYMMKMLVRHGTAAQKQKYLPGIASGALRFQSFGVTEPTTGSDTPNLKTRAVREGDHYVVTGQKVWISRVLHTDLMTLLVRTTPVDQVTKRTDGLSLLLVDVREAIGNGLTVKPIDTMVNHQVNELFFDGLRVPAENLIGVEGQGLRHIFDGMNAERILIAHESLGDCRFFIEKAAAYAKERVVFGRPIGQNQGIQLPMAKAYAAWRAADQFVRMAAAKFDAGQACGEEANISKLLTAEAAWDAAEMCMQTHGGFAIAREYDIERKWRHSRIQRIAPISTNLILSYIGQNVLGLPRSY
jgi:acyl-CoA dehydrogenase